MMFTTMAIPNKRHRYGASGEDLLEGRKGSQPGCDAMGHGTARRRPAIEGLIAPAAPGVSLGTGFRLGKDSVACCMAHR